MLTVSCRIHCLAASFAVKMPLTIALVMLARYALVILSIIYLLFTDIMLSVVMMCWMTTGYAQWIVRVMMMLRLVDW